MIKKRIFLKTENVEQFLHPNSLVIIFYLDAVVNFKEENIMKDYVRFFAYFRKRTGLSFKLVRIYVLQNSESF